MIVIGDVVGKGMVVSFIMVLVKVVLLLIVCLNVDCGLSEFN